MLCARLLPVVACLLLACSPPGANGKKLWDEEIKKGKSKVKLEYDAREDYRGNAAGDVACSGDAKNPFKGGTLSLLWEAPKSKTYTFSLSKLKDAALEIRGGADEDSFGEALACTTCASCGVSIEAKKGRLYGIFLTASDKKAEGKANIKIKTGANTCIDKCSSSCAADGFEEITVDFEKKFSCPDCSCVEGRPTTTVVARPTTTAAPIATRPSTQPSGSS